MSGLNQVGFNGYTFSQNIPNVDIDNQVLNTIYVSQTDFDTTATKDAYNAMNLESGGTADAFFNTFSNAGQRLPVTYDQFVDAFREGYLLGTNPGSETGAMFDGFVTEYRNLLKIDGGSTDAVGGDWSDLSSVVSPTDIQQQFVTTFNAFLASYPYKPAVAPVMDNSVDPPVVTTPGDNGVVDAKDFFNNWYKFLTVTSTLGMVSSQIASYQDVYNAFGFPPADFQNRLVEFYNEQITATRTNRAPDAPNGYFIPSRSFSTWFDEMVKDYKAAPSFAPVVTSVSGSHAKRVLLLEKIFKLIVMMIDSIQKVAAAQASGLNFLTVWQKAYVDRMNQVPTFVRNDGTAVDNGDAASDAAKSRQDLNKTGSAYTERLRANRDLVGDDAKALQSNVNQSNDAVTQQSNLASSIIQQFSTILGSIYR